MVKLRQNFVFMNDRFCTKVKVKTFINVCTLTILQQYNVLHVFERGRLGQFQPYFNG